VSGQAASGYIDYHPEKHAFSPFSRTSDGIRGRTLAGVFPPAHRCRGKRSISMSRKSPRLFAAARASAGTAIRSAFSPDGSASSGRLQRQSGLELDPALEGVEAKLKAGAKVADVGCGHGASYDRDGKPIRNPSSRLRLSRAFQSNGPGVGGRGRNWRPYHFRRGHAKGFPAKGYDLVAFFRLSWANGQRIIQTPSLPERLG